MAEFQNRLDPYPPAPIGVAQSRWTAATLMGASDFKNRLFRHYGKYQRSVRLNSAFCSECMLEMTVLRRTRMEAPDDPS